VSSAAAGHGRSAAIYVAPRLGWRSATVTAGQVCLGQQSARACFGKNGSLKRAVCARCDAGLAASRPLFVLGACHAFGQATHGGLRLAVLEALAWRSDPRDSLSPPTLLSRGHALGAAFVVLSRSLLPTRPASCLGCRFRDGPFCQGRRVGRCVGVGRGDPRAAEPAARDHGQGARTSQRRVRQLLLADGTSRGGGWLEKGGASRRGTPPPSLVNARHTRSPPSTVRRRPTHRPTHGGGIGPRQPHRWPPPEPSPWMPPSAHGAVGLPAGGNPARPRALYCSPAERCRCAAGRCGE